MPTKSKTGKKVLAAKENAKTPIAKLNKLLPSLIAANKARVMGELLLVGHRRATVLFIFDAVPSTLSNTLLEVERI